MLPSIKLMRSHGSKKTNFHRKSKDLILIFLLGFFLGGILFFLFQKSYMESLQKMDLGVADWAKKDFSFVRSILYITYEHGKYFILLLLLSTTKIAIPYMIAFASFRGFGLGFLFSFFVSNHGLLGVLFFLGSGFPQGLLLAPIYLFMFEFINHGNSMNEKTIHTKKTVLVMLILTFILLVACFLEAYFNIPIMRSLYS